jgi:hypothetical protein
VESKKHHSLVKIIYDYVIENEEVEESLVQSDIFEIKGNVTRMPEGFVPDLYYKYDNKIILGEAKTDSDLDREHSILQFKSYINYLKRYSNLDYDCMFIIAVPWEASIAASRIIRRIINEENINLIVLNESGVFRKYEKNNIR